MSFYTVIGNKIKAKRSDGKSEFFDKQTVDTFISKSKTAGFNNYIIAAFLAVSCKESKLKPISENLNYSSSERLKDIYSPFFKNPANGLQPYNPNQYTNNPEKLGNLIYF